MNFYWFKKKKSWFYERCFLQCYTYLWMCLKVQLLTNCVCIEKSYSFEIHTEDTNILMGIEFSCSIDHLSQAICAFLWAYLAAIIQSTFFSKHVNYQLIFFSNAAFTHDMVPPLQWAVHVNVFENLWSPHHIPHCLKYHPELVRWSYQLSSCWCRWESMIYDLQRVRGIKWTVNLQSGSCIQENSNTFAWKKELSYVNEFSVLGFIQGYTNLGRSICL